MRAIYEKVAARWPELRDSMQELDAADRDLELLRGALAKLVKSRSADAPTFLRSIGELGAEFLPPRKSNERPRR